MNPREKIARLPRSPVSQALCNEGDDLYKNKRQLDSESVTYLSPPKPDYEGECRVVGSYFRSGLGT